MQKKTVQKIYQRVSSTLALLLFLSLIACSTGPQVVSITTLTEITPSGGTNNGGVEVTLTGTNIFDALTEDYDQKLQITVCGQVLTNINVVGTEKTVKAQNGKNASVIIGTSVTGTTAKVQNPKVEVKDVVLTRPDGTAVTLEGAFTCDDAPVIQTPVAGLIEFPQGAVDLDLNSIIQDADGDPFTVSIEGLPASLSFDPSTLKLTGTLTNADVGTKDITVKITDSDNQTKSYPIKVQVNDINDAPEFDDATLSIQEVAQSGAVVGNVLAVDVDDLSLEYEILSGNTNNTFALNAFTGRLTVENRINHSVTPAFNLQMKVSDPDGLADTATIRINVARDNSVYNWRLSSTWPTADPVYALINTALANTLVPQLSAQSAGQIRASIVASSTLNTNVYSEVSSGTFELGHSASYLHADKAQNPAYEAANLFFTSQPFGLSEAQHKTWLRAEGQALWDEVNAPHNLIAFRAGTSGDKSVGWFRQPITNATQLEDLKWYIAGYGARVASQAKVELPSGPITKPLAQTLVDGDFDAVRWGGPFADKEIGLDQTGAVYYTGPDWAEKTASLALYINLEKYNALPVRLQTAIQNSAEVTANTLSSQYATRNAQALAAMRTEGVTIISTGLPADVLSTLQGHADAIQNQRAASDALHAKVYESWKKYR